MKREDVPQDQVPYYGERRRALYAQDSGGAYGVTPSSGWSAEAVATLDAGEEFRRLAQEALARARAGRASPLEFHMYDRRMDPPTLAETSRIWKWRVRRHLRPEVFPRLSPKLLQRYAEALGVPADQLKRLP